MTDLKQRNKTSIWETWFTDWMKSNSPAVSLQESKDVISRQELLYDLFLCTGENLISIEVIHQTMHNYECSFLRRVVGWFCSFLSSKSLLFLELLCFGVNK